MSTTARPEGQRNSPLDEGVVAPRNAPAADRSIAADSADAELEPIDTPQREGEVPHALAADRFFADDSADAEWEPIDTLQRDGDVPLMRAAWWIAMEGGRIAGMEDETHWRGATQALVQAIAGGKVRAVGFPGEPDGNFKNMQQIEREAFSNLHESLVGFEHAAFSDGPWLLTYPGCSREEWNDGMDDRVMRASATRFHKVMVAVGDVRAHWLAIAAAVQEDRKQPEVVEAASGATKQPEVVEAASGATKQRRTPALDSAIKVISDKWPDGIPKYLRVKSGRNPAINAELEKHGLQPVGERTIREALCVLRARGLPGY